METCFKTAYLIIQDTLHKYVTVGSHRKSNPTLLPPFHLADEISRDRTGDKAYMHHRGWPESWREIEGDPKLAPILGPGKELPSMAQVLRGTPEKGLHSRPPSQRSPGKGLPSQIQSPDEPGASVWGPSSSICKLPSGAGRQCWGARERSVCLFQPPR